MGAGILDWFQECNYRKSQRQGTESSIILDAQFIWMIGAHHYIAMQRIYNTENNNWAQQARNSVYDSYQPPHIPFHWILTIYPLI